MIELNKKYVPLFESGSRYFVVTGGRGSGKSFALNSFLLLLTYEVGHVILFTRYTLTSAHIPSRSRQTVDKRGSQLEKHAAVH